MDILKGKNLFIVLVNTSSQFLIKLLTSVATLVLTIAITHYLGLQVFGSVTKIIAFVGLFYLFVDFGFNAIFLKDFAQDTSKYFFNLLVIRFIIAVFLIFIIALLTQILPYNPVTHSGYSSLERIGIIIFSTTLITQALLLSVTSIFQRHLRYDLQIWPQVASFAIFILVLGTAIALHNMYVVLLSYFVSGVFFFMVAYPIIKRRFDIRLSIEGFSDFSKRLITSSFPLGLMLLFNLVYFHADTIILSFFRPNLDVGVYGFSYKIFEFIVALPTFFANSIYPVLLEHEQNEGVFYEHVKSYSLVLFGISIIALVGTFLFAPIITTVNPGLSQSVLPLRILSVSFPIFFLTGILQWVLIIKGKKVGLLFIYLFSMLVNVVLNLTFIPKFGYIAAAVTTDISEGLVLLLICYSIFTLQKKIAENER